MRSKSCGGGGGLARKDDPYIKWLGGWGFSSVRVSTLAPHKPGRVTPARTPSTGRYRWED